MAETKFTPGPWEIRESATQIGRCFRVSTRQVLDGNHGAALLYDDSTSLNPHGDGVQKANARLIAAAPEMYGALTCWPLNDMLGLIEDSGDVELWNLARLFMEVRDAALAKAVPHA